MDGLFDPAFMAVIAEYGLTLDMAKPAESILAIYDKVWDIQDQIEKSKGDKEAVKVANHPYDLKAQKDKEAAKLAKNLIDQFVNACSVAIDKNSNVAWHLAEHMIGPWLTSEVHYQRSQTAPNKPASAGTKLDTLYEHRKILKKSLDTYFLMMPGLKDVLREDGTRWVKMTEKGEVDLPNLQGRGAGTSETPTGRDARRLQEHWSINGKVMPVGTPLVELRREIWPGIDGVGKKSSDLLEPIDKAWKKAAKDATEVSVTINGKVITNRKAEVK